MTTPSFLALKKQWMTAIDGMTNDSNIPKGGICTVNGEIVSPFTKYKGKISFQPSTGVYMAIFLVSYDNWENSHVLFDIKATSETRFKKLFAMLLNDLIDQNKILIRKFLEVGGGENET